MPLPRVMTGSPSSARLNVLALPSLTGLLFALQALVIMGAALASLLPDSRIGWPLILLPILLLTLRDFLQEPERLVRRYRLGPAPEAAPIEALVAELSRAAGLRPPQVLVGTMPVPLFSFGSFRRHGLAVGRASVPWLRGLILSADAEERRMARVLIAHELAHFANRDIQVAGLARSLLKMTALYTLFSLWVALVLVMLLLAMGPEITQERFWLELGQSTGIPGLNLLPLHDALKAYKPDVWLLLADPGDNQLETQMAIVYLSNVFLPFILALPILIGVFWRKLIRVREFYADAYAAAQVGGADVARLITDTIALFRAHLYLLPMPVRGWHRWRQLPATVFAWPTPVGLLSYAPRPEERAAALAEPLRLFGAPWQMALWTGLAVLLLELILRNSLTVLYITQPGAHLALLTAATVFSLWLLPRLAAGLSLRQLLPAIGSMVLVFGFLKLVPYLLDGLFLALAFLSGRLHTVGLMLDVYLRAQIGLSAPATDSLFAWSWFVEWHLLRPLAYYAWFGLPLLLAFLLVNAGLWRGVLTWYACGHRIRLWLWLWPGVQLIGAAFIFIPVADRLFFPAFYEATPLFWLLLSGSLLLMLGAGLLFALLHRRWGCRCPRCGGRVPGPFRPGKRCPHCQTLLHPWLLAPYS